MSPAEKEAIEQALNQFLQGALILIVLSWWLWWAVRKVGADRLFSWPQVPAQQEKAEAAPVHNVSSRAEQAPQEAPLPAGQPQLPTTANPIAKPQNSGNHAFAVATETKALADLLDVDPEILEQQLITLARLCDAEEVGVTAALKIGLGISPGSNSAKYTAGKAALAALRVQPKTEIVGVEQDPTQPNRAIVVRG